MKKILCLIGQLGNGGTEKQLYLFLKHLDAAAYSSVVFVTGGDHGVWAERIKCDLREVEMVFTGEVGLSRKILIYRSVMKKFKPDIVFSWSFFTNPLKIFSTGTCFIGSLRQQYSEALTQYGAFRVALSKSPNRMIVNSTFIADELERFGGYPPERISVVLNMLELPLGKTSEQSPDCGHHDGYTIPSDKIIVMGVGGDAPAKNFEFFIDVVEAASKIEPRLHGVIVGSGGKRVEKLVAERNLKDNFTLTGEVPSALPLLRMADIFFLSSKQEGLANVLVEALAVNRAVLATNVGGVKDVLKYVPDEMLDKILLSDFNIETAAAKLLKLAEAPETFAGELRPFAEKALEEMTPERVMPRYLEILESQSEPTKK